MDKPWYSAASWDIGGEALPTWISYLQEIGCRQANLTHHLPGTHELDILAAHPSTLSWSIHLSSKSLGIVPLEQFLQKVQLIPSVRELLVVSGHPRPPRTSFSLLEELSQQPLTLPNLALAVSPLDTPERVREKMQYPAVKHLYLQLAEPEHWDPLLALIRRERPDIQISACWLPPTKSNWTALKLFPWKGSVLSDEWRDSLDYAQECAESQLNWMREYGVQPLIEPRRITSDLLETVRMFSL